MIRQKKSVKCIVQCCQNLILQLGNVLCGFLKEILLNELGFCTETFSLWKVGEIKGKKRRIRAEENKRIIKLVRKMINKIISVQTKIIKKKKNITDWMILKKEIKHLLHLPYGHSILTSIKERTWQL